MHICIYIYTHIYTYIQPGFVYQETKEQSFRLCVRARAIRTSQIDQSVALDDAPGLLRASSGV